MNQGPTRTGDSKKSLREGVLAARGKLGDEAVKRLSERVKRNLSGLREYSSASVLGCYVATEDEVQTDEIIASAFARGVRVLVPLVDPSRTKIIFSELHDFSELAEGHFGIREPKGQFLRPAALEEAEAVIVPLVAWDVRGFRIGHGKGYFDAALSAIGSSTPTIGLAFEMQMVRKVPDEPHDVPLKFVVTESRVIRSGCRA